MLSFRFPGTILAIIALFWIASLFIHDDQSDSVRPRSTQFGLNQNRAHPIWLVSMKKLAKCNMEMVSCSTRKQPLLRRGIRVYIQGHGTVSSSVSGIDCGRANSGICSSSFARKSLVVLEPIPMQGWELQRWAGDCFGYKVCEIRIRGLHKVWAVFSKKPAPRFRRAFLASPNNQGLARRPTS